MGKLLIIGGIIMVALGLIWTYEPRLLNWFGKLPGDINIKKGNTFVFFPITSMIVVSILVSGVLWLIRHFK